MWRVASMSGSSSISAVMTLGRRRARPRHFQRTPAGDAEFV
jgi:hypothetical protein